MPRRRFGAAAIESPPMIKIFGERNTSTNALKKLIETNSASKVLPSVVRENDPDFMRRTWAWRKASKYGPARLKPYFEGQFQRRIDAVFDGVPPTHAWKHTATYFDDISVFDGVPVVFNVRHPASWLLSLYKNPYENLAARPASFGAFLDYDWKTAGRENLDQKSLKPAALYAEKLASYQVLIQQLKAAGLPYQVVKFEDIILDQAGVFERLRPLLQDPAAEVQVIQKSTKTNAKDLSYYQDYYGNEAWRAEISEHLATLRLQVPAEVCAAFDYEI